jgi:ketosteroid isomerase-like protein
MDKRDLVNVLFSSINNSDFDSLVNYLTTDASFDFPGTDLLVGQRKISFFMKVLKRKYPDLTFTVNDIIISDNKACAIWTNKGTETNGTKYQNSGVTIFNFDGDKIKFLSDYFKDTSFV